jgi:hypothetical protein
MDVQMFRFAIPAIVTSFAITNSDVGLIGTATLLTSAIGEPTNPRRDLPFRESDRKTPSCDH